MLQAEVPFLGRSSLFPPLQHQDTPAWLLGWLYRAAHSSGAVWGEPGLCWLQDCCWSVQLSELELLLEPQAQGIPPSHVLPSSTSGLASAAAAPVGSCECWKHTQRGQRCSAASRAHPATHMQNFISYSPLVSTLTSTPAFAN